MLLVGGGVLAAVMTSFTRSALLKVHKLGLLFMWKDLERVHLL